MVTKTGTINGVFGVQDTSGVLAPAFATLEAGAYTVQKDATPVMKNVTISSSVYLVGVGTGTFAPNVNKVAPGLFLVDPAGAYTFAQAQAAVDAWRDLSGSPKIGAAGGGQVLATATPHTAPASTTAAAITMA